MKSFTRERWLSRWIAARPWLAGALKALAIIAVWALVIWLGVWGMSASGLLAAPPPT